MNRLLQALRRKLDPRRDAREIRRVALLTVGMWTMVFLLMMARLPLLNVVAPAWAILSIEAIRSAIGAAMCALLYVVFKLLAPERLLYRVLVGAALSLLFATVLGMLSQEVMWWFRPGPRPDRTWQEDLQFVIVNADVKHWLFFAWCCAYFWIDYVDRLRANELRLAQVQAMAADAQNRMLRYQINPHFLFNTLNALSDMVLRGQTRDAEKMLMSLSGFLRYSLSRSPEDDVPLAEEIGAQEEYLAIEEARFGDRLRFVRSVEPEVEQVPVPSLILQPLVENAVKYATHESAGPVRIELIARREGERVRIEVRDDGPGVQAGRGGFGIGLDNVRKRLELAYRGAAELQHGPLTPRGYAATLLVPLAGPA